MNWVENVVQEMEKYLSSQLEPLEKRVEDLESCGIGERCSDCQEKARNEQLEAAIEKIYDILVQVM